jgi:hypothetical protein
VRANTILVGACMSHLLPIAPRQQPLACRGAVKHADVCGAVARLLLLLLGLGQREVVHRRPPQDTCVPHLYFKFTSNMV